MKKLNLSLRILTLFVLALSLNACFVKTSIPTTEVRLEPIRQLSEYELLMRGFVYHEIFQTYIKEEKLEKNEKERELEEEKLKQQYDGLEEEMFGHLNEWYNDYKIIKNKYIVGHKRVNRGPRSYWHTRLIRLKEKDYEVVFSSEPFSYFSISDDEKYILICNNKDRLKIFDTDEDLKELKEWENIEKCYYPYLSFDNNYLIVSYGSKARIYDFKTQEFIYDNPSIDSVCGTNNIVCMYVDNGKFPKDYIVFTNDQPQRFLVKEVAKGFDHFYEIKNRGIGIYDLNLKDNEVQMILVYYSYNNSSLKSTQTHYYLAKLVPIEKGKKDKK